MDMYRKGMQNPNLEGPTMISAGRAVMEGAKAQVQIDQSRIQQGNALVDREIAMDKLPHEIEAMKTNVLTAQTNLAIKLNKLPLEMEQSRLTNEALQLDIKGHSVALVQAQNEKKLKDIQNEEAGHKFDLTYGTSIQSAMDDYAFAVENNTQDQWLQDKQELYQAYKEKGGTNSTEGKLFFKQYSEANAFVKELTGKDAMANFQKSLPTTTNEAGENVPDTSPEAKISTADAILANPGATPWQKQVAMAQRNEAVQAVKGGSNLARLNIERGFRLEGEAAGMQGDELEAHIKKRMYTKEYGGPNGEAAGLSLQATTSKEWAIAQANNFIRTNNLQSRFKEFDGPEAFDKMIGSIEERINEKTADMSEQEKNIFLEQLGLQFITAQSDSLSAEITTLESQYRQQEKKVINDPATSDEAGKTSIGGINIVELENKAERGLFLQAGDAVTGLALRSFGNLLAHDPLSDPSVKPGRWMQLSIKSDSLAYKAVKNELESTMGYLDRMIASDAFTAEQKAELTERRRGMYYAHKKLKFGWSNTPSKYEDVVGKILEDTEAFFEAITDVPDSEQAGSAIAGIKGTISSHLALPFIPETHGVYSAYRLQGGGYLQDSIATKKRELEYLTEEMNQRKSSLYANIQDATDSGRLGARNVGTPDLNSPPPVNR